MPNRALIVVIGALSVAVAGIVAALFVWYDGDKTLAVGAVTGLYGLAISNLLALRQSTANAEVLKEVKEEMGVNTAVTQTAKREITEVKQQQADTHDLVDGQAHEWRAGLEKIAKLEALIAGLTGAATAREEERQIAKELIATGAAIGVQPLPGGGVVVEPGPDGTIAVTAPATIEVKAPPS